MIHSYIEQVTDPIDRAMTITIHLSEMELVRMPRTLLTNIQGTCNLVSGYLRQMEDEVNEELRSSDPEA